MSQLQHAGLVSAYAQSKPTLHLLYVDETDASMMLEVQSCGHGYVKQVLACKTYL